MKKRRYPIQPGKHYGGIGLNGPTMAGEFLFLLLLLLPHQLYLFNTAYHLSDFDRHVDGEMPFKLLHFSSWLYTSIS
jgi:hypothetical protein